MNIPQLYEIFQRHPVITTDSRHCPAGSIFFALKGGQFDGNDYIEQALASGAAYAVGDSDRLPNEKRIIPTDDALQTLQLLANYHRKLMPVQVIAITGTNGKTTTKELTAAALSSKYPTLYTQGNLNNHIGVPLTLLQLKREHEWAVIEMGANHPGEIQALCQIADPDYGLITNIGKAHLEGFGSLEGVVRTKTELYEYLREKGGIVFGNLDNPILRFFYDYLSMVYYGTSPDAFIRGKIVASAPTLQLEWQKGEERNEIVTHLAGDYNFENVLAAICIASYLGVEKEKINRAIVQYIPANYRSQNYSTGKNELIIDAYNANPDSMRAALQYFDSLNVSPKMVILGEMRELGDSGEEEHKKLIGELLTQKIDQVFLVGEIFQKCAPTDCGWQLFSQTEDLITYLKNVSVAGYHILMKGSRGNQLEKTIPLL
ncbi:MAG: UDP-N-acetylmuramoyl-tripeptide--D-alanyl-D-alanine ligase [Candidatus Azobacteroides sp.]|nr:UDP-N-acetylmuramoyl-tripeptide--D-alanyl-D-alanine ligase [Candidatus Azobacteroides sp.]